MSLKTVIQLSQKPNIAEDLSNDRLATIAQDVIRRANEDDKSMKEWSDCVREGLKLCKPDWRPLSTPWDGAANFKTPLLTEAANNFGNRVTMELMRDDQLVKAEIAGAKVINNIIDKKFKAIKDKSDQLAQVTAQIDQLTQQSPNDPQLADAKKIAEQIQQSISEDEQIIKAKKDLLKNNMERADRVTEAMNWQINVKQKDWRKDHKRIMYALPNYGAFFKKTYYDETTGTCQSDIITWPNFSINQASVDLDSARSFTHYIDVSANKMKERINSGLWIDAEIYLEDKPDEGSNEEDDAKDSAHNSNRFLEQYCWVDIDEDGYAEPYIVTVHEATSKVVRIVARYSYEDIYVSYKGKTYQLDDAIKARAAAITKDNKEFNLQNEIPDSTDITGFKVIRVKPKRILTKYGFIPAPDGSYLDVGFFYLIGSIALGLNKSTNDLLNNSTLATMTGGIAAKGFRQKQGPMKVKPGEWMGTDIPADQLKNSIMPWPFKEPSQTLYALNEKLEATARNFISTADMASQLQANTAPTTALAMIQESMINQSAHMSHIAESMSNEFAIMFELNRDYLDDSEYQVIVCDEEASVKDDFSTDGLSIACTANPELASRMQRMALADAEVAQIPLILQAGGNPIPIIKKYLHRIGTDNIDEIFPNEAEMSPQDKQQVAAMKQQQEQANKLAEQQTMLLQAQYEQLKRGEDRKDAQFTLEKQTTLSDLATAHENREKTMAETQLTQQKAISEKVNSGVQVANVMLGEIQKDYEALERSTEGADEAGNEKSENDDQIIAEAEQ